MTYNDFIVEYWKNSRKSPEYTYRGVNDLEDKSNTCFAKLNDGRVVPLYSFCELRTPAREAIDEKDIKSILFFSSIFKDHFDSKFKSLVPFVKQLNDLKSNFGKNNKVSVLVKYLNTDTQNTSHEYDLFELCYYNNKWEGKYASNWKTDLTHCRNYLNGLFHTIIINIVDIENNYVNDNLDYDDTLGVKFLIV